MTNDYIKEIYQFVQASFKNGQRTINIDIYPFKMTDQNLIAQRGSPNYDFWKQLQPGYKYFEVYRKPPEVDVIKGKYVVDLPHDFQDPENAPMFAKN
jgi:murein L,D-transpeptidase YafK